MLKGQYSGTAAGIEKVMLFNIEGWHRITNGSGQVEDEGVSCDICVTASTTCGVAEKEKGKALETVTSLG